jgi:hypothetical protein
MTLRRNQRPSKNDPASLAARLPDHLREFKGFSDFRSQTTAVADWLNTQVPGAAGQYLTATVMELAGVGMADYFKIQLRVKSAS